MRFLLAFIFCMAGLQAEIPAPYNYINDLPFDGQGWFMNANQLDAIIREKSPQTVIEVGSWLGSSTRFIAERVNGKVYAVDTWQGSSDELLHQNDPRLPYLYQLFLSNVKHAGLTDKIVPVRMRSLEAAKSINIQADLIYIDAGHDETSVYKDIKAWIKHLKPGGVICGDDWAAFHTVKKAVIRAANDLNKTVVAEGNFWRFVD